jgi:hypothetical protein
MATSRSPKRGLAISLAAALPLLLGGLPFSAAARDFSRPRAASSGTRSHTTVLAPAFSWLHPSPAPAGWTHATIASGAATLFYPANWAPAPGDTGTVTAALRDRAGVYHGYLNVTPRQGSEALRGWASFRTRRNAEEGDKHVQELAAAEDLRFRDARGSCVIDDYISSVGSHPYREIACIVAGRHDTSVFVGATLRQNWPTLGPIVEHAAADFLER